ncbi:hypothetical protein GDO81_022558 [Engystomops pustulosus]|uniref:Uncharacterized protein n=1 Tax=Engystomops pustulosus TaxID=76066 RepID=A0AAV6YWV7_ENGPU|nr:hypothetical protein GDO81_022558 [Engystomops pustulosus]
MGHSRGSPPGDSQPRKKRCSEIPATRRPHTSHRAGSSGPHRSRGSGSHQPPKVLGAPLAGRIQCTRLASGCAGSPADQAS